MDNFVPTIRFIVTSDIHYCEDHPERKERFEKGMALAFKYAASQQYNSIDAFFAVGDFANSGTEQECLSFRESLEACFPEKMPRFLMTATHEYKSGGVEAAYEKLNRIFSQQPDNHVVINGCHFICVSVEAGNRICGEKKDWVCEQLKSAAADGRKKPIFFFQHPHLSDTVYGSINWGENDIIPVLMDYPQVIDFSGHSHAPVNDPRSVHQKYFTSVGTGSFAYFELDEFDKIYGTVPPDAEDCAQFLIVEADSDGRVVVKPFDVLSESFFPYEYVIEKPWEPESFVYTVERYKTALKPYFAEDAALCVRVDGSNVELSFPQAKSDGEYVNDYLITVRRKSDGTVARQVSIWSSYYLQPMPDSRTRTLTGFEPGEYSVKVTAHGFWNNCSSNSLSCSFAVSE